jgi:branched-chain amino acid transport system permease protein
MSSSGAPEPMNALLPFVPYVDAICISSIYALSQFVALRAGLFSLGSAGFASIGAYTAAIALVRYGVPAPAAIVLACVVAVACGLALSLPLARLRGHFQAVATVGFVEIIVSLALYFQKFTGGPAGINGIPKLVGTGTLVLFVAAIAAFIALVERTSVGRAFGAIRQDDIVARSLGVSVARYHRLAFALSAGIAGIGGALASFNTYSIEPQQFGFALLTLAVGAVILGGRSSVSGPIVGTAIFVLLPELARPLAENRFLLQGALLIVVITYLPQGIVDTLKRRWAVARARRFGAAPTSDGVMRTRPS